LEHTLRLPVAISCINFMTFAGVILYLRVDIRRESVQVHNTDIQRLFVVLYVNIICLIVRSIYRLVAFVSDLPKPPLISPVFHDGNNGVYYVTAGGVLV
jgi:FtsH-binding integral membrane protein